MLLAPLPKRLAAEAVGTALLVAAVVGSGIMGDRLSQGNTAIALLANSLATGAALAVILLVFGPVSGAHLNPVVTCVMAARRDLRWRDAGAYLPAQVLGGLAGVIAANVMFGLPPVSASIRERSDAALLLSEGIATFGLLATILGCARSRPLAVPYAVAAYITAGYWFTSSTSFANPAVTLARAATDTFTGIRPADVGPFIAAQAIGAAIAGAVIPWILGPHPRREEAIS